MRVFAESRSDPTSGNDKNVNIINAFALVYIVAIEYRVFVEVSGYNLPKKVYLLVIPPLEKGGEGGI